MGMINTALPRLADDLALSATLRTWIADIYPLCLAIGIVSAARAGDALGRRRLLVAGLVLFGAASAAAATASTGAVLLLSRSALGVAGAMVVAGVVSTIGAVFDGNARTVANGWWVAVFGAAAAIGPIVGGTATEIAGWRSVFWISVPCAAVGLLLTLAMVPETRSAGPVTWDPASIVTSAGGLGLAVYSVHHLAAAPIAGSATAIAASALLIWFVRRQRRLTDPMIDVSMFARRRFSVATVSMLISSGAGAAAVYLLSIYLQAGGRGPLATGIVLLPQAVATTAGGLCAPAVAHRLPPSTALRAALILQAVGLLTVAFLPGTMIAGLALVGLGFGIVGTLGTSALFDSANPDQVAQVGAVQEVAFALGAGGGIAVFGTVASLSQHRGFPLAMAAAATACLIAAGLRNRPSPALG
ncbi:MFS transporter [Tsukamurella sp. TY48]|nr:MFS transporter [Tsukamurella sp. TY48]